LPLNINEVPLPIFVLSIDVIDERCNERSENMVFRVTEYWSTITAEVSGRAIMKAETRRIGIRKIKGVFFTMAVTRKTAPTMKWYQR